MTVRFKLKGRRHDSEDGRRYNGEDYWLTDDGILKFRLGRGKKSIVLFLLVPVSWVVELSLFPSITFAPLLSFFLGIPALFLVPYYLRKSERRTLERLSPEERLSRAVQIPWSAVESASLTPVPIRDVFLQGEFWYLLTLRPYRERLPVEIFDAKRRGLDAVQVGVSEPDLFLVESFLRSMIGERLGENPPPTIGPPIAGNKGMRWKPHAERLMKYLAAHPKELGKIFAAYDESGLDGVVNYLKEADPDLTGEEADHIAIEIILDRDKLVRMTREEGIKEERWSIFSAYS